MAKYKSIGSAIAEKSESKGLNRAQLAKRVKISTGYLSHIEKDHISLSPDLASRFEKALGVKFSKSDLEKHNESAKQWLLKYRADLKAKRAAKKSRKVSSAQPQLTGFTEMQPGFNIAERVAELVAQALLRGQQTVETVQTDEEEIEVIPVFKKSK